MRTVVHVISDLHLGGAPVREGKPDFRMCSEQSQQLLVDFIDQLPGTIDGADSRLVIAGDIVDFLAEEPFEAFTHQPADAEAKLRTIFERTDAIWRALSRFLLERGGALTLLLGNHDVELALPSVRQLLLTRLGGGRVEFIYDNEAFTLGPLLIEHGNRFDAWNAVPHGALRRMRSQLSRRMPVTPAFEPLPGSMLVQQLMNPLKARYAFVDLLKPEDAAALPILAALGVGDVHQLWVFFQRFRQSRAVDYDEKREPLKPGFVAAADNPSDQALYALAMAIASGGHAGNIAAGRNLLADVAGCVTEALREARREALYKAFRGTAQRHQRAFDVGVEVSDYLTPAQTAVEAGFKVVVYGHTHHAKRIQMNPSGAVYLNTGTWADLMHVPLAVWDPDENLARAALTAFVNDLERNQLDQWRRGVATYARIEIDGEEARSADVYFAADHQRVTTDLMVQRLTGERAHVGR